MKTFVKGMLVVGTALLLGACTMAKAPSVSSLPETEVAFPEKESYIIGPSDVLEVNVWKEPDLTRQAEVRMDGKITLPMIVSASWFLIPDARKKMAQRMKRNQPTSWVRASLSRLVFIGRAYLWTENIPLRVQISVCKWIAGHQRPGQEALQPEGQVAAVS